MKYRSSKILGDFEYHDAQFAFESFNNRNLTITARYLNIHKSARQNPYSKDMEIELARITFQRIRFIAIKLGGARKQDEPGGLWTEEPQAIYEGKTAEEKILSNLRSGVSVKEFGVLDNGNNYFDGIVDEPWLWFQAQLSFESAFLEWDAYSKPAWYEERPFHRQTP